MDTILMIGLFHQTRTGKGILERMLCLIRFSVTDHDQVLDEHCPCHTDCSVLDSIRSRIFIGGCICIKEQSNGVLIVDRLIGVLTVLRFEVCRVLVFGKRSKQFQCC